MSKFRAIQIEGGFWNLYREVGPTTFDLVVDNKAYLLEQEGGLGKAYKKRMEAEADHRNGVSPRRKATLLECILWAKDRLMDDMASFAATGLGKKKLNFAAAFTRDRKKAQEDALRMAELLNLPDDTYETLWALERANYWNGRKDTYFEECDPPDDYMSEKEFKKKRR